MRKREIIRQLRADQSAVDAKICAEIIKRDWSSGFTLSELKIVLDAICPVSRGDLADERVFLALNAAARIVYCTLHYSSRGMEPKNELAIREHVNATLTILQRLKSEEDEQSDHWKKVWQQIQDGMSEVMRNQHKANVANWDLYAAIDAAGYLDEYGRFRK